jgi:hypothetical protein
MEKDPFWIGFYKQIADICFLEAKRRIEELLFYTTNNATWFTYQQT